mgnify:FL=1
MVEKRLEESKRIELDAFPELEKLNISKTSWLYMDAFNFLRKFYGGKRNHWHVLEIVPHVQEFVEAAKNSGWEIKVFIDAVTKTGEAKRKWESRREKEVKNEKREMPQGMNTLLGDAFRLNGIEVLYSFEEDNDDTLAAYAQRDNADILSGDRDFFRYIGLTSKIYEDFKVVKKELKLKELKPNNKVVSKRNLISPPPKTMDKDPTLLELSQGIYRRGAPSPLVKLLGNPHVVARPLRQALYSRKNISGPVTEIFPVWDGKDNKVIWTEDKVTADKSLDELLDFPEKAMEVLFPKSSLVKPAEVSDLKWQNHLYAIHSVVYELCALGNRNGANFLQMFKAKIMEFQSLSEGIAKDPHFKISKERDSKRQRKSFTKSSKEQHSELPKEKPSKSPEDQLSKKRVELPPAYKYECRYCKEMKELSGKEVLYYQTKGFQMPKQCKACKQTHAKKK